MNDTEPQSAQAFTASLYLSADERAAFTEDEALQRLRLSTGPDPEALLPLLGLAAVAVFGVVASVPSLLRFMSA